MLRISKMASLAALLSLYSSIALSSQSDNHGTYVSNQLENWFREHKFELSLKPIQKASIPLDVGISLLIESITDISEVNMDITFTYRMSQSWHDYRLIFNKTDSGADSIVLPNRLIENIWIPDLFIIGSKSSFIHNTASSNAGLRLYHNGTVVHTSKLTSKVTCHMQLYNFPLDMENCSFAMQSLGHYSDEMLLHWTVGDKRGDIFMDEKSLDSMPKFQLEHHFLHANIVNVSRNNYIGQVSQLKVSFEFKRYLISVFFQSYFPSLTVVILAGMGTMLDPTSAPARVGMGITAVLTIATVISGLKSTLPKISYLTAMDLYLWICFLFVFSTVLEYCIINSLMTGNKQDEVHDQSTCKQEFIKSMLKYSDVQTKKPNSFRRRYGVSTDEEAPPQGEEIILPNVFLNSDKNVKCNKRKSVASVKIPLPRKDIVRNARQIEKHFIFYYFLCFALFNIVYWSYYALLNTHTETV